MKFFESFGFKRVAKSIRQYRNDDTELTCSEPHAVARVAACIIVTTRPSLALDQPRIELRDDLFVSVNLDQTPVFEEIVSLSLAKILSALKMARFSLPTV